MSNKSFWETLCEPWKAALEMAWEAYCTGNVPIGAVVADRDGKVVSRARNRLLDQSAPSKQIHDNYLAHAEINALLALNLSQERGTLPHYIQPWNLVRFAWVRSICRV